MRHGAFLESSVYLLEKIILRKKYHASLHIMGNDFYYVDLGKWQ